MKATNAFGGALAAIACVLPFAAQDDRAGIEWHTDLGKAHRLAKDTGRPLLVEFR